jgi:type II secretory pathway pseudopilin PulG
MPIRRPPHQPYRPKSGATGFSLAELVIAFVIVLTFAGIAIPRFGNSIALQRVEAAARRISNDLVYARQHAMTTSTNQEVRFAAANDPGYTLVGMQHLDRSADEYAVSAARDLDGAEGLSIDFGGDLSVIFDIYGKPDSGGTVQIRVGIHDRTITLDAETGRASISG